MKPRKIADANSNRRLNARSSDNPDRILEAAIALMAESGFSGTSISRICKKCQLPATSIYWHFGSKDQLLAAAIEHSAMRWLEAGENPPELEKASVGNTSKERLDAFARFDAQIMLARSDVIRLLLLAGLERGATDSNVREVIIRVRERCRELLSDRFFGVVLRKGKPISRRKAEELARFAMAFHDGVFIASQFDGDQINVKAVARQLSTALVALAEAD